MAGTCMYKLPGVVLYSVLNNTVYLPKGTKKLFDKVDPSGIRKRVVQNKQLQNHAHTTTSFFTLNGCKINKAQQSSVMSMNKNVCDYSWSSGCYILKNVHEKVTVSKMTVAY